jgi:hypothetical protein
MVKKSLWVLLFLALALAGCSSQNRCIPANDPSVIFTDDFSDKSCGWDQVMEADGATDYTTDGKYRIYVNTPMLDVWSNPKQNFTDVIVEVDATKAGGPDDNLFGILCRYQDKSNYYELVITSDGYYDIRKIRNNQPQPLLAEDFQFSDKIPTGGGTVRLGARCVGPTLTLLINGIALAEVQDDDLASGDIGLIAGTFSEPAVEIHFDNLVVRKP